VRSTCCAPGRRRSGTAASGSSRCGFPSSCTQIRSTGPSLGILGRMTDPAPEPQPDDPSEDLVSALEVIEDQPLAQRADGYAALHDELARRLDAGGPP